MAPIFFSAISLAGQGSRLQWPCCVIAGLPTEGCDSLAVYDLMPKCKPRMERQLNFSVMAENSQISVAEMESPSGYKGFYRFHKYWGKKPHEPLAYVIEQLTIAWRRGS